MNLLRKQLGPFALFLGVVVSLQLTLRATGMEYCLTQLTMSLYYAMVVIGLCLVMGYAGQVSLGHGAFFAIGGYTSAVLTTYDFTCLQSAGWAGLLKRAGVLVGREVSGNPVVTVSPWAAFLVAMGAAFLIACFIGYPALRLKGHYLAMATLGFGLIVNKIILGSVTLGAADGLNNVPEWNLGFGLTVSSKGTWEFSPGELKNSASFISTLANDPARATQPISQFVWSQFSPETQQRLTGTTSTAAQRQAALVEELNQVLRNDALYEPQRFAAVPLSGKARRLAAQEPTDEDLVRLNRMLLESAYPAEVVKSRMHTLRVANYYIAGGLVLLLLVLLRNLVDSRVGRALRAIHDRETAANAMGINTANYKLKAFVLSAMIAAMAGVFFTHYTGGIGPSEAGAFKSVRYVALAAAGGMASLWGVTAMSTILNYLSLRGLFGSFDHAVFGAILIIIVSVAPEGPLKPLGQWIGRWVKAGRARVTRELGGSGEPPGHGSPPAPPEGGTRTERRPDYGAA